MAEEEPSSDQKPKKGYGKRPLWQWIVIYVVIAAVVYGAIAYIYVYRRHHNSSSSNGTTNSLY